MGSYIVKQLLEDGHEVFATSRSADLSSFSKYENYHFGQMDFTDPVEVYYAFESIKPNVVVHSGAMSKPDDCEIYRTEAYETNVEGTVELLQYATMHNSFFVYISSDFVFNGNEGMHAEADTPDPINYYGKTKMEAEKAVQEYKFDWAIVRTVFVYGKPLYGRDSFVTMIAKILQNNDSYKAVNDQERTPTYVEDLAKGIAAIINKKAQGTFHLCGKDMLTPYAMALKTASLLHLNESLLHAVTCKEFKEIARRPLKSGLSIAKAQTELGYEPLSFEEGLQKTFGDL